MNKEFITQDLWLSAFLKAKGMKITRIQGESRRAIFVFEDIREREELVKEFYNNGLVGITILKNAMTDVKSAIFNMV
ncbi:MAG TPA: hypothetical protein DCY56_06875 [Candidatus Omnitrophica bacterium]|nr:hypothetical protein [Candidatus Omnitrophota bacterium]